MRKRTIKYWADKLLWLVVMLLPLLAFLIMNYAGSDVSIVEIFDTGFNINDDNIVYNVIDSIFGVNGHLPLYGAGSYIPLYITYLASVVIIQIAYDFIVFLPKLCHKYMHRFTQDEE